MALRIKETLILLVIPAWAGIQYGKESRPARKKRRRYAPGDDEGR